MLIFDVIMKRKNLLFPFFAIFSFFIGLSVCGCAHNIKVNGHIDKSYGEKDFKSSKAPLPVNNEIKTFVHTVRQSFGGSQSPDDARIAAIAKAKREVLEVAGTYIESLFTAEETELILRGVPRDQLPQPVIRKLENIYLLEDLELVRRNLRVLLS